MSRYNLANEAERMVEGMKECRQRTFEDGRQMYAAFRHLKQYRGRCITFPTGEQSRDLARSLDLSVSYVRRRVEFYLFGDLS